MKIDAVITWVDGNDPAHKAKMAGYGDKKVFSRDDIAGSTRFASVGEIAWCVASINRFAPFINKIFIVTDAQDPCLGAFLHRNFPQGHIPVEIVDHKVIFRGYEEYLPVFNSLAIESVLWRIPGLSEHFIYFNDDWLLAAPVKPEDFYTPDGGVVCYATKHRTFVTDLTRAFKTLVHGGQKRATFKGQMRNAVSVAGGGLVYLRYWHTPRALLRSFFEEFYSARPEALVRNISHRFRDPGQYCPEEVQFITLYRQGRCELRGKKDAVFYFQMKNKPNYLDRKLRVLEEGHYLFCCFNSLDKMPENERARIVSWIEKQLDIKSV